jgi:thiol-disulfide isomerase/thioredoxin
MKYLIPLSIILLFSMCANSLFAQVQELKSLRIDDTIPNLSFILHTGASTRAIHLKDYSGKAILLDFWGTDCGECIAHMPEMLELQKQFESQLKIIVVTPNTEREVNQLWKDLRNNIPGKVIDAGLNLPFIVADTTLKILFPYNGLPMHVWIDKNQVFKIAAESKTTTPENIQAFVTGKNAKLTPYHLVNINGFNADSWLEKRVGYVDHLINYSILSKFDENASSGGYSKTILDSSNHSYGLLCYNVTILNLFQIAYFKNELTHNSHILLDINTNDNYIQPEANTYEYSEWIKKNLYCYTLKTSYTSEDSMFSKVKRDLGEYFHLEGNFEERRIKCWILKRISSEDRIRTKGLTPTDEFVNSYSSRKILIKNMPISTLFNDILNSYFPAHDFIFHPVINETNYKLNIDIMLPWGGFGESYSIAMLRKSLEEYGLDLVQEDRYLNVLVIKDKKG